MTSNWALLPRIISDHQSNGAWEREKPKTEISILQPDVLFVWPGPFHHLSLTSVDQRFIADSCVTFQHVSKTISFKPQSDKDHSQLQRGLFFALNWESKPWGIWKALLFQAVFAFPVRSRQVGYWALVWSLGRSTLPVHPVITLGEGVGAPVKVVSWQGSSSCDHHQGTTSCSLCAKSDLSFIFHELSQEHSVWIFW